MAVFNLYSKRQKVIRGEVSDVFVYDKLPKELRVQITLIIKDAFGVKNGQYHSVIDPDDIFENIHDIICREYGVHDLGHGDGYVLSGKEYIIRHILYASDIEKILDVVELCFRYISRVINKDVYKYKSSVNIKLEPAEAIEELNIRFKENGVGFQFESDEIIRIDSTFVHNQMTKPVLMLLNNPKFIGANEEYLKAHEHYRHGRNKECLTECLKSLESTMKIICDEKRWIYNQTDTAKKLIQVCFQNGLVPTFTQNQFTSLQNLIESGIPTIRNKVGGHGQGKTPQVVDDGITRYGLNLTASNIIYLIEQSGIS